MTVKSLVDLASTACIKHIRQLDSIGDYLPYENVRHILLRIEHAHQLRRIEINSPQLQGRTGEIWLKLIERDFPIEYRAKGYKPQDPSKWYRVWERYKKDHDASVKESALKLKSAFMGLRQDKEQNTSRIVEKKLLPRGLTGASKRAAGGPRDNTRTSLAFASGSRTKTISGAGVMRKVKREVKEMAKIHGSLSTSIRAPLSHAEVKKAPPGLVSAYQRASKPSHEPLRNNRASVVVPQVSSLVKEHEARATFISDSEGEDDNDDHDDDRSDDDRSDDGLFDEPDSPKRPAPKPVPNNAPRATKGLGGRLAQKFGGPSMPRVSSPITPSKPKTATSSSQAQSSSSKTSVKPQAAVVETSPPDNKTSSEIPPVYPRKRKAATSLFHKPTKRVN